MRGEEEKWTFLGLTVCVPWDKNQHENNHRTELFTFLQFPQSPPLAHPISSFCVAKSKSTYTRNLKVDINNAY